jgi:tetratricopeptide (TPR) repeat protein
VDEAERAFEQGIERSKDSPIGYYYLGRIEIEAKQFDRAIRHLDQAIQINPHFEPAYMALAALYETQQDRPGAIRVYRKYLQVINPQSKEMRHHLIRLYLQEKAYRDALGELDTLLRDDPDDLDAQLRIGLVYGELKEYPKAIAQLTKVLSVRPAELRVRDYLGLMYEEVKEYDKAIEAYQANLKVQPTYTDGHLHLGFLYYRLKQSAEAIPHLVEVVKQNPKQSDAYLLLGLTYLQSEQYALASQAFEEGIRYNPANPDLHFNLGTVYDKLNRFDDVVRTMESALKLDPKHADTLNYLGYTYADRGIKIPEAVELTQRAVSLKPDNGYYVDSLAWALFKMGRLDDAKAEITRAATLVKDDPVIYEHLGEIYLKQNLSQEAKEAWLHSLELDPSNAKLIDRYKERGFGDPTLEERVREAKRRVSQNTVDSK